MASRSVLYTAAVVCIGLCAAGVAMAQDGVHLRPSYRAEFLPPGTEIVVLTKEAGVVKDGRVQPEFIPLGRYPRERIAGIRKDRLGQRGLSEMVFQPSPRSRTLYFLYALTPDSTLYWSYSAQRDSLKFDVVSTGVMSVAPVPSASVRSDVLGMFFQPRVIVHMPEDRVEDEIEPAAGDSMDVEEPIAEAVPETSAVQVVPVAVALPASPLPERKFPYGLTVLGIMLLAGSGLVARRYQREIRHLRRENLSLRSRLAALEEERASPHDLPS